MDIKKKKNILLLCLLIFTSSGLQAQQQVVLNISSYHEGYGWSDDCIKGINQKLAPKYKVIHHYMDTKRLAKSKWEEAAEAAWNAYLQIKPDVVMLGDDNALKYLGPKLAEEQLTSIYYGINANPRTYFDAHIPSNIIGVLERILLIPMFREAIDLVRGSEHKRVTGLSDGSTSSAAELTTIFHSERNKRISDYDVLYLDFTEWIEWKNFIRNAHKNNDALVLVNYHSIKDKGKPVDYKKVLAWTSENTKIPFLIGQKDVGPGMATGAILLDGVRHGTLAAELADKVLQNKQVAHVIQDTAGKYIFSDSQLRRFNIRHKLTIRDNLQIVE